jgi:hypothetical protein
MLKDRVQIFAIGIDNYDHLKKLSGPSNDVKKMKALLVEDDKTALFTNDQFQEAIDISSQQFRDMLIEYSLNRTAPNDIAILYFSGHGAPVGNHDLGLCFKDTRLHFEYTSAPSLSVAKFKDIIETLALVHVDPVIIIDACFSGQAGLQINNIYEQMQRDIQAETGSNYALFCSSGKTEASYDSSNGGLFSRTFVNVASNGIGQTNFDRNKEYVTLTELYPLIMRTLEKESFEIKPKLYVGGTLPEFGFIKNILYNPVIYSFSSSFKKILNIFWNDGDPKEYTTEDLRLRGCTEQTTYSKLSYEPGWALIEKPKRGIGRLTQKGINFINGKITIPYEIKKEPKLGWYVPLEDTRQVYFDEF